MPWLFFVLVAFAVAFSPRAAGAGGQGQERILMALMTGETVVYIRHPEAIVGVDLDTKNLDDCSTQRVLTPKGRVEARHIGEAFERRGIPIGQALTSPFCRTKDAAIIAFGEHRTVIEPMLKSSCKTTTEALHDSRVWLRQRLATKPEGGNVFLMGHNCNIRNVLQPGEFHDCARKPAMGDAIVFRPEGDGFSLVGCLPLATLQAWGGNPRQADGQVSQIAQ